VSHYKKGCKKIRRKRYKRNNINDWVYLGQIQLKFEIEGALAQFQTKHDKILAQYAELSNYRLTRL